MAAARASMLGSELVELQGYSPYIGPVHAQNLGTGTEHTTVSPRVMEKVFFRHFLSDQKQIEPETRPVSASGVSV